jgi:hypothetical protein
MFGAGVCSSPSKNADVFARRRPLWPPQASQTRIGCGLADAPPPRGLLALALACGAQAFCALPVGVAWITLCRCLFPN